MLEATDILKYKSLAIVGLEKNTGKTECLNYLLRRLKKEAGQLALTSIGIDGESRDQVCQIAKPEIEVPEGMVFVTSEKHYRQRRLFAEVLDVGEPTALGRLVTARALSAGKVLLSGPADTRGLRLLIARMQARGIQTTLVDGALSRLSLASPVVTEAMILATGAALSGNIPELVRKTRYVYELIGMKQVEGALKEKLEGLEQGVWSIGDDGEVHDLELPSVLMLEKHPADVFRFGHCLYVTGMVSDKLLNFLRMQPQPVKLIVRDFTRIFASPESWYAFLRKGGEMEVVQKTTLLAVTVNPQSPAGFSLDSQKLRTALEESLKLPVYDVRKL